MLRYRKKKTFQFLVAAVMTAILITLWMVFDLSYPILPILIILQWIPYIKNREQTSDSERLLLLAMSGLTTLLIVGSILFLMVRTS